MKPKKGPCKKCAAWDIDDGVRKLACTQDTARCIRRAPGTNGFPRTGANNECFDHIKHTPPKRRVKTK